jgi:hypothetical protein
MQYRTKLFYFGCVPARLSIATVILLGINPMVSGVSIFGCIALAMAIGFLVNHYRHKKVGFFGGQAWWHDFRKFHTGIWVLVSILLFLEIRFAGVLVLYDLIPGIIDVCRGVNL